MISETSPQEKVKKGGPGVEATCTCSVSGLFSSPTHAHDMCICDMLDLDSPYAVLQSELAILTSHHE